MRVDWCVSLWFRITRILTHTHFWQACLPAFMTAIVSSFFLFVSPNSHERRASPRHLPKPNPGAT